MSLYSIFYFEDDARNAEIFLKGMAEDTEEKIKIVWFSKASPSPIPNENYTPYCPLIFEAEDELPKAYILENKVYREIPVGQEVWWQSEFDAAVLDIYGSNKMLDGLEYAKWFELASFIGPVVLVSFHNIPHLIHNRLPKLSRLSKTTDSRWISDVASTINDYYHLKFDSLLPSTGVYGFRKGCQISKFQEFSQNYGKAQGHIEFNSLWISETEDQEFERAFLDFLCIKEGENQLNRKMTIQREYPRVHLKHLQELLARFIGLCEGKERFRFRKPNIIFLDLGSTLSSEQLQVIKESILFKRDNGQIEPFHPLVGIFCEKTNITFEDFEGIEKYCISVISREEARKDPTIWAKKVIENFAVCINDLLTIQKIVNKKNKRDPSEVDSNFALFNAKRSYFKNLLEALLFARSKSRIYSADDVASIVPWLSDNPLEAVQKFNTNVIGKMSRDIRAELIRKQALNKFRAEGIKL